MNNDQKYQFPTLELFIEGKNVEEMNERFNAIFVELNRLTFKDNALQNQVKSNLALKGLSEVVKCIQGLIDLKAYIGAFPQEAR
jgi:hypothetical protein